jgi:hypothetical protein
MCNHFTGVAIDSDSEVVRERRADPLVGGPRPGIRVRRAIVKALVSWARPGSGAG